jgi:RimJ/RimL family protein N-acetyltransferase
MAKSSPPQPAPFPRPLDGEQVTPLPSARVPSRAVISGSYAALEPLDNIIHGDSLYQASHGSQEALHIWDYLPYGPWEDRKSYGNELRSLSASQDKIFYAIRSLETGEIGGQASFMDMRPTDGVIEIGAIWFGQSLRQTRAATEALYIMLDNAMTKLGYRRMQWRCNALNQRSRDAASRLGFRYEGTFYNHLIFKGRNRDTAWFSILDDEWPQAREVLQQWLAPENFDDGGRARTSLRALMETRAPVGRNAPDR